MIETKRLVLTRVTPADIDIYTRLLTCPETTRYLPGGKPFSSDYIEAYVRQKVAHWDKGFGTFIVSLRKPPLVKIGYAGVEVIPQVNLADVRYAVLNEYQGQGYAFEAVQPVIDRLFSKGIVEEIYGVAVPENSASIRILEKLGMSRVKARLYEDDDLVTMSVRAG